MSEKEYPCNLTPTGACKYGGNKVFNYGFMRGSAGFCRHPKEKRFTGDMNKCPLEEPKPPTQQEPS